MVIEGLLAGSMLALAPASAPEGEPAGPPRAEADAGEDAEDEDDDVRTIVVTGTRTERSLAETPVATQVVEREEIVLSGGENVAEVLEEAPGVVLSRGVGGTGIVLQGLDPRYTLVLVDGQRTTGRVDGTLDLTRFPAEDVERIEIVRGPGSVLYGADALAGTVNLVSRRPARAHEAEVHTAYGSFRTLDLTGRVGLSRERWAGSVSAGLHRTDGWDADPSDIASTGSAQSLWRVGTRQELRELGPVTLVAMGDYLRRGTSRVDAAATGAVFDRRNLSEVITTSLAPTIEVSSASTLRLTAGYNLWRDQLVQDQRGSAALDQAQDTWDHIGQIGAQYDHELEAHRLTAGADALVEELQSNRIEPSRVDRQRYAIFAQDEWTPSALPRVSVLAGARLDVDTFFGIYPTPRAAVTVTPTKRVTIRASYGRGYRAPSFREMFLLFSNPSVGYVVRGNESLRPETSWSTNLSLELRPWSWLGLAAHVFDHRLQDTIVVDTVADEGEVTQFGYVNVGEAQSRGVETLATLSVLEPLRLEGSYSFTHTWDVENRRPLPGRPRHYGTAGLAFVRERWGTSLRVRAAIIGRRSFFGDLDGDDVIDTQRTVPFATLDLRIGQALLADRIQAFAGVENLLDAGDATTNPIPPRSFYGGVTVRY